MSREESALPDELRKEDARARTLAQREFERPVVVEAGAGTGKTTALVARVLAWSFGPGWDCAEALTASTTEGARDDRIAAQVLRGVVAITFTEKAAAEMSERIGKALLDVERRESPGWLEDPLPTLGADELCARARALRGSLDHLVVQTIHAYCRRLLVENSLDARLHPNLEIDADGRLQEQAVRSAMEAALETAYASSGDPGFLCGDRGRRSSEWRQCHHRHRKISRCAARDIERGAAFGSSWPRAIRRRGSRGFDGSPSKPPKGLEEGEIQQGRGGCSRRSR